MGGPLPHHLWLSPALLARSDMNCITNAGGVLPQFRWQQAEAGERVLWPGEAVSHPAQHAHHAQRASRASMACPQSAAASCLGRTAAPLLAGLLLPLVFWDARMRKHESDLSCILLQSSPGPCLPRQSRWHPGSLRRRALSAPGNAAPQGLALSAATAPLLCSPFHSSFVPRQCVPPSP
jgi:hypothetical protein